MDQEALRLRQPLETVCIEVPKVYDFCFQTERRENICTTIDPPPTNTVNCIITATTCTEVSRTAPNPQGRSNVTFAVTVTYTLEVLDSTGAVVFTLPNQSFSFTKTVVLCAPAGTFTTCEIVNTACTCVNLVTQICCTFDLCIIIQSLAIVKLLVPSFGFCTPSLCEQVSPVGPFVCPPTNLFPPQCPPIL